MCRGSLWLVLREVDEAAKEWQREPKQLRKVGF
jgi:hypothetical protein